MTTTRSSRRVRPVLVAAALLVLVLVLAPACGRGGKGAEPMPAGGAGERPAPVPGFDGTTIKVGALSPLSGPVGAIGVPLTEGNRVFFDGVNAGGGIAGRYRVEVVAEDTLYDNPTTVQKYQKVKDGVVMFAQVLGTPPTNAVLPQLKADNVTASPASLDAGWLREPNLLPFGAPYQVQFLNAANYYVNEAGGRGRNVCMMALEGPYGDAGVEGLQAGARAEGFVVKATARFRSTDQDFPAQIAQLQQAACDAVFLTSLPSTTGAILGAGDKVGFRPLWIGQSPSWATSLSRMETILPILESSFLVASEGSEWGDESVPGMRKMLADIARFKPDQQPDGNFQFGYSQGAVVTALLEKAVQLGDLSRAGILAANRSLGRVEVGGLLGPFEYGPIRNPSRESTIFRVDRAVPGALRAVKKNFASQAARDFPFAL